MKATWKTKDGKKIKVKKMDDNHLINTIKFLYRKTSAYLSNQISDGYGALGSVNGEMASMVIENELYSLEEANTLDYVPEIFWTMVKEANKRKLEIDSMYLSNE